MIHTPHVLVLTEKHGRRYFLVNDVVALNKVCRRILETRKNEGCWYDEEFEKLIDGIDEYKKLYPGRNRAWDLLVGREFHEYEGLDLEPFEELDDV